MTRAVLAILMLVAWCETAAAQVFLGSVTPQPSAVQINPGGATTVRVRWRIELVSGPGGVATVSSPAGILNTSPVLGGALSRTVRHPGGGSIFVTLVESLYVDRTNAGNIASLGGANYNRVFSTAAGTALAFVRLEPSSGGALSLRHLDLSFDDGNRYRVLDPGDPLSARLTVTTSGRGFFSGRWEVAGPVGSAFRPLTRVSRRLSGARRTVFESPALPTDRAGIYRVRFVPDDVVPGVSRTPLPELTYSVVGQGDQAAPRAVLGLLSPQPGADISRATRFAWQPVEGAARYRIEFSAPGRAGFESDVLAAVAVAGSSARLKPNTLARLGGQSELYWRVIAFDGAGAQIAASPRRRLR